MLRALPGSPFDEDRALAPEIIANLEAKYGLDKSVQEQYWAYVQGLSHGDLGPSLKYPNRDVQDILWDAVPVSLSLGAWALLLSIVLGIVAGILAAVYPRRWYGKLPAFLASLSMSVPSFIFAAILVSVFGLWLKLVPVALWEGAEYMILPVITLAIAPTAYITRITRSSMLDTLAQEHIKVALAKGLTNMQVILRHGLRNSLLPIITVVGPLAAILVTGSFVVEHIYALPGMGKYFVTAFINRDYFLVSGVVLIFGLILLVANTIVELFLPVFDPRLRR